MQLTKSTNYLKVSLLICPVTDTSMYIPNLGTELSESNLYILVELIKATSTLRSLSLPAWIGFLDLLAAAISTNTSLEQLELRKLQFTSLDPQVTSLAHAIRNHPRLQQLRLGSNCAPPIDVEELIEGATASKTLHTLMLVNFGMKREHLCLLAEKLGENSNIQSVDVKGNDITLEVVEAFYRCLQHRPKLKFLNMSQSVVREAHTAVQKLKERVILLKVEWF